MSDSELTTGTATTGRLISAKTINDNFNKIMANAFESQAEGSGATRAIVYDNSSNIVKLDVLPVDSGGTGAGTAAEARTNLGITPANIGAATSTHTHTISLTTDSGTSSITLASAGKYKLTAGGSSVIFTMPTIPAAYTHPTTEGNKHIPSGGSSGQFLG